MSQVERRQAQAIVEQCAALVWRVGRGTAWPSGQQCAGGTEATLRSVHRDCTAAPAADPSHDSGKAGNRPSALHDIRFVHINDVRDKACGSAPDYMAMA